MLFQRLWCTSDRTFPINSIHEDMSAVPTATHASGPYTCLCQPGVIFQQPEMCCDSETSVHSLALNRGEYELSHPHRHGTAPCAFTFRMTKAIRPGLAGMETPTRFPRVSRSETDVDEIMVGDDPRVPRGPEHRCDILGQDFTDGGSSERWQ